MPIDKDTVKRITQHINAVKDPITQQLLIDMLLIIDNIAQQAKPESKD